MTTTGERVTTVQIGGYPPPHGGVTIHVQELAQRLRRRSVSCRVLSTSTPGYEEVAVPEVCRFHGGRGMQFAGMLRAAAALRPQIVHVHMAYGANALPWVAAFARIPNPRASLLTVHSGLFPAVAAALSRSGRYLWGRAIDQFSVIIAVNPEIRNAVAALGVSDRKIEIIPAYFPPEGVTWDSSDTALANLRKQCGLLVFTSGFLHPDWGILRAARSLRAIRNLEPGMIVAHSGVADPDYEKQVRSAVPDPKRLLFYGELPRDRFLGKLAAADIYIRASLYDGDSLAVREALGLGKAVIASDCAGRPAGCTLFPTDSQEALNEALRRVASHPRSASVNPSESGSDSLLEIYSDLLGARERVAVTG
jgi:glycosyltransferase involved in cell wall biosynthesis